MFKLFQRKRHKKNWRSASELDLYELSEQETDMLMGGSPVKCLIAGAGEVRSSQWQPNHLTNFEGTNYQPFQMIPTQSTWQQSSWRQQLSHDPAFTRQTYPYNS